MKIMVIGGGGREHAIIRKLKENPAAETIYALPGNGGIAADAVCVPVKATDLEGITAFAREKDIEAVNEQYAAGGDHNELLTSLQEGYFEYLRQN